jgi:Flp pilus assembly protein TadB
MESEEKEKKKGMFAKIESREDALKTIKDCAYGFFTVAAIQAGLGYFFAPSLIIDAALYVVLAGIMIKWHSRVAAVFLLIIACFAVYMTVLNRLGMAAEGGNNIFLAAIILWAAIRSVEATFKVNGKYAEANI